MLSLEKTDFDSRTSTIRDTKGISKVIPFEPESNGTKQNKHGTTIDGTIK